MPDSDDGLGRVWSNFSLSSLSPTWDVAPDKVFALNATTTPLSSVNNVAFTTPQNAVLQGQWVLVKNATASSTSSSTNGTLSSNDTVTATASNDTLPQVTIAYHGTDCYFTADVTPANTSGDRVGYLMIDGKLYANASDPWDPTDDLISTDGLAYGGHTASFNVDSDFVGKIVFKSFAYTSYTETLNTSATIDEERPNETWSFLDGTQANGRNASMQYAGTWKPEILEANIDYTTTIRYTSLASSGTGASVSMALPINATRFVLWGGRGMNYTSIKVETTPPLPEYNGTVTLNITWDDIIPETRLFNARLDPGQRYTLQITPALWEGTQSAPSAFGARLTRIGLFSAVNTTTTQTNNTTPVVVPPDTTSDPPSKSHTGAIAGGVVGGVVALTLLLGLVFFLGRRRRPVSRAESEDGMAMEKQPRHSVESESRSVSVVEDGAAQVPATVVPFEHIASPVPTEPALHREPSVATLNREASEATLSRAHQMKQQLILGIPPPRSQPLSPMGSESHERLLSAAMAQNGYGGQNTSGGGGGASPTEGTSTQPYSDSPGPSPVTPKGVRPILPVLRMPQESFEDHHPAEPLSAQRVAFDQDAGRIDETVELLPPSYNPEWESTYRATDSSSTLPTPTQLSALSQRSHLTQLTALTTRSEPLSPSHSPATNPSSDHSAA